jgi:hypothetical protein
MERKNPFRPDPGAGTKQMPRLAAGPHTPQSKREERIWDQSGNLNPLQPAGNKAGSGSNRAASRDRMFDAKGQVNAYDNADVLRQIAHLLQNVTKQTSPSRYRNAARSAQETREARQERMEIVAAALKDPTGEGFAIVGQELLLPIKDIVDYEGWARKVYRVRPLAQAELFRIAKDVRSVAFVVGQDGQAIEARLGGKYIQPDETKIVAFTSVDITDIYQMNYDVLDRAQDTARQEIELNEDKRGRLLIDRAARTVNTVTTYTTLGTGAFEDVRFQVERHRLIVEKFLINRAELSDVVKTMSTTVDPVTERELILAGYIGNYLNAQIITTAGTGVEEVVPAGTFYAVTGSEYLGEMGVRIELFSEPYNKFVLQETVKGWAFIEQIGFGIPNARAAAVGEKP